MPRYGELKSSFKTFEEVPGEAEPKWHESGKLMSFNAYFGARAIAEALDAGAQIVVTGALFQRNVEFESQKSKLTAGMR